MRTCPWCEGRKVVGRMAYGEEPKSVTVLGVKIPVIGTMLDVACRVCEGTGQVPDDFELDERMEAIKRMKEARRLKDEGRGGEGVRG